MEDFKEKYLELQNAYSKNKHPIPVNFREIVETKFQERATHLIHTYPAKLIPNIPFFFLNNSYFIKQDEKILDPFAGSGTVLLEGQLAGLRAYGSDANPLARLISKVKTNEFDIEKIERLLIEIENSYLKKAHKRDYPNVINIDYWFLPHIKEQLNNILKSIEEIENIQYKDFFLLNFSNLIKKVSLADSRVSVPVKLKPEKYPVGHSIRIKQEKTLTNLKSINVFEKFKEIIFQNLKRFKNKNELGAVRHIGEIISNDARKLEINHQSIDLIITSPPYAGAQKYIRASSLSLGWTKLGEAGHLKSLDSKNIGRENYKKEDYRVLSKTNITDADIIIQEIYKVNPLRAHIAANYLIEMTVAIQESIRVLKKNKYFILVAANNNVCGFEFKTQEYLRQIAINNGMEVKCELIDDIKSYGLMTKRNKTASIITCEYVLILKRQKK